MRRTLIAAILLVAGGALAASNPPTPSATKPGKQEQTNPAKSDNSAGTEKQTPQNQPVIIENTFASHEAEYRRKQEADPHDGGPFWKGILDAIVGPSTAILAIITGILAFFTYGLWRSTGELVSDAKKTTARQLRAYVHTHCGISGEWRTGKPFAISVEVHNFGATPAHGLDFVAASDTLPVNTYAFPTIMPTHDLGDTRCGDLGPGAVSLHPHRAVPLTQQEIQGILDGQKAFVFWTIANYVDAFGEKRTTTTCHHINAKTVTLDDALYVAPEGNLST